MFARACRRAGVRQSMGRTVSALDNAAAESFNLTLEFELLSVSHFATRTQARRVSRFLRRVDQVFVGSAWSGGWLIHAAVGRAVGSGCLRTNRSGVRA